MGAQTAPSGSILNDHRLSLALAFLALAFSAPGAERRTIKGAVAARSGGASATGVGIVRLISHTRIYELHYSNQQLRNFPSATCLEIGAVWQVTANTEGGKPIGVHEAFCVGAIDPKIAGPLAVVKSYLRDVFDNQRKASDPRSISVTFTPGFIGHPNASAILASLQQLKVDNSVTIEHVANCLEVTPSAHQSITTVETGPGCALKLLGRQVDLSFDLVKDRIWKINRVRLN